MSGRKKFSDLREEFFNDPERGAERREEVEELGRAYDAMIALHEAREPSNGPAVGEKASGKSAENRPPDPEHRGGG